MKQIITTLILSILIASGFDQNKASDGKIYLLVRADDIASFHVANIACIRSAIEGIAQSIEIMVTCA